MSIDPSSTSDEPALPQVATPAVERYRSALSRLPGLQLVAILQELGTFDRSTRPGDMARAIEENLNDARSTETLIGRLDRGARLALGLFAITDSLVLPAAGLTHALAALGKESGPIVAELMRFGLLVAAREGDLATDVVIAHPAVFSAARSLLPEGELPPTAGPPRQVREADGLEPILRLAALWQRVDESALRRTQQGTLYKRDRERIEDDPVLVGPIADALEPLPDMSGLWLSLARGVGLVADEEGSDRTVAAPAEFWAENGVHLPQMIAQKWLGLSNWHEQGGLQGDDATAPLATPYVRPVVLLWLARFDAGEWVAIDDLAARLDDLYPAWSAPLLTGPTQATSIVRGRIGADARQRSAPRRRTEVEVEPIGGAGLLDAILLGPAYQLGLVRAAEENPSGRRIVQITDLGRYALGVGPPPVPRETFEHFLFVQPNFEVIAYRQGLNAALIGQLSRFMTWTQSGAALEMKLTPASVYRGLEGGLTPDSMIARLARHSGRPLPSGVSEAVKTWSDRRDRVTFYGSATLIEFASPEALDEAIGIWPGVKDAMPIRVSERVVLVRDEGAIPFNFFKLSGSRDYRRPPEACVEIEADGVTLDLDHSRSDLFIDAEIARLADEIPQRELASRRRFRVTPESLTRAVEDGLTASSLSRWFAQRAGADVPPAIRLLLHASSPSAESPKLIRPIVLNAPTADLLDGLLQHPSTRGLLGDRLGPTSAIVPEPSVERLRAALAAFGLNL